MDALEAYVKKNSPAESDPLASYVAKNMPQAGDGAGAAKTALDSFADTATLGYLPHLQALAGKLVPDSNSDLDASLAAQGFKISQPSDDNYVASRDKNIAALAKEKKDHPYASAAGTVAGLVGGGLLIPGSSAMKGAASLGQKAIQGAKAGAAIGLIQNPGDVEGDVTVMPMERLKNAGAGAVLGAAIPTAMDLLGKGGAAASEYFGNKAAKKAVAAAGKATPTDAARMAASGQDVAMGRDLLDEGAIPVLGTPGRIAKRVDALKEKAGEAVGNLVKLGGDAPLVDSEKLGIQILDSPEIAAMRKTPGMESTVAAIEKQVETLAKNGQMTLERAQALRQDIDKSIKFNKRVPDMTGAQEGLYKQRTAIRDAMNEAVNNLPENVSLENINFDGRPVPTKDALLAANRKYGNLAKAEELGERAIGQQQNAPVINLKDLLLGQYGPTTGAKIVLGAISKAGRTFGNSMQARGYDAVANQLAKVPSVVALAQSNPGAVAKLAAGIGQEVAGGRQDYKMSDDPLLQDHEMLMLFKKDESLLNSVQDPQRRALIKRAISRLPAGQ